MLATYLHVPELELEKAEAERLSTAVARVLSHYPVNIAPQSVDIVNLVMAAGMIYGSRIMAYRVRKNRTNAQSGETQKPPEPVKIFTIVPPGSQGAS